MYREDGEVIEVPEDELPLKLPDDIDLSIPGNPLDHHPTWKYTTCPSTGMKAVERLILWIHLWTLLGIF